MTPATGENEKDAAAVLRLAVILVATSSAIGLVARLLGGARPDGGTVSGVVLLLVSGATLVLLQAKRIRLASYVFIGAAWLIVGAISISRGGLYSGTIGLYLLCTVMAGVLVSPRACRELLEIHATLVENGLDALAALARKSYDVVLMDVHLPEMDGQEATRQVRGWAKPQPWIIAVTASALPGDSAACFAAGANAYLAKPVKIGHSIKPSAKCLSFLKDDHREFLLRPADPSMSHVALRPLQHHSGQRVTHGADDGWFGRTVDGWLCGRPASHGPLRGHRLRSGQMRGGGRSGMPLRFRLPARA